MMPAGKLLVTLCLICFSTLQVIAQQFSYGAQLEAVDSTGFYSIAISPQVSAFIKNDFADIRVADINEHWVPHIIQSHKGLLLKNFFTEFPILENRMADSGKTLLVLENIKRTGIDNLKLFLKNAAVSRTALLSGSNNQLDWYIIDDQIAIDRSYETTKDEYLQALTFPLVKYRYLKIVIENMRNDPLLITKAGSYANPDDSRSIIYKDNPAPFFIQKDSNHYSYIEVRQANKYQFDKITLGISGPKFYSRNVSICFAVFSKNNFARPGATIGNFKLNASLPATFELPRTKASGFFIIIDNADNPPLKIEKIQIQQQQVSLISYLEKGKKYQLLLGDSMAAFADYDLPAFKDSIALLRDLNYSSVYPLKKNISKNSPAGSNWWIWPTIVSAVCALSFLSYRLVVDINKTKK